jgi:hypothetical protein
LYDFIKEMRFLESDIDLDQMKYLNNITVNLYNKYKADLQIINFNYNTQTHKHHFAVIDMIDDKLILSFF